MHNMPQACSAPLTVTFICTSGNAETEFGFVQVLFSVCLIVTGFTTAQTFASGSVTGQNVTLGTGNPQPSTTDTAIQGRAGRIVFSFRLFPGGRELPAHHCKTPSAKFYRNSNPAFKGLLCNQKELSTPEVLSQAMEWLILLCL